MIKLISGFHLLIFLFHYGYEFFTAIVDASTIINNNVLVTNVATNTSTICPQKCICKDYFAVKCVNLNANELVQLLGNNGSLVKNFATTLTNLTIQNSELYDLTGLSEISKFAKLLFLDLSANQIASLLSPNDHFIFSVIALNLDHNKLPSITRESFLMFPNVEEISIRSNGIFTIDWEAFRLFQLKKLILSHNHLATINEHMLRFTPNLEFLDLSHNQLSMAQSSSFFAAQHLSHIDLSFNRIQRFHYDSFSPLFQLESFNLAFNNLSKIPTDLRQFIALKVLNISGNHFDSIRVGALIQPILQILDVSHCKKLKLIEADAFSKMSNLQTVVLSNNPKLNYISPYAFRAVKLLFELDLSNNLLKSLDELIFLLPTRLQIASNPFICSCIFSFFQKFHKHIVDAGRAECLIGSKPLLIENAGQFLNGFERKQCSGGPPLVPFGVNLTAEVGEFFSLYCAPLNSSDSVLWTFPNATQVIVRRNTTEQNLSQIPIQTKNHFASALNTFHSDGHDMPDHGQPFFTSTSLHFPHLKPQLRSHISIPQSQVPHLLVQQRPRIVITSEQMQFELLTENDSGTYRCKILSEENDNELNDNNDNERVLQLNIRRPSISMMVLEIGSHYVSLTWNDSLKVKATDKVRLSLDVRDSFNQLSRSIQLSPYNPWYSYNVMRLKPLNNYTFCLVYRLLSYSDNQNAMKDFGAAPLFETCVSAQTSESLNFWNSLSTSTIVTLAIVTFCIVALLTFRALYLRFYIWHETKLRARMNESMSGQSFLSNSSSIQNSFNIMSQSITFENTPQIFNQSTHLSGFPNSSNAACYSGRNHKNGRNGNSCAKIPLFEDNAV